MSHAPTPMSPLGRAMQVAVLVSMYAALYFGGDLLPELGEPLQVVAAVGFLLLAGTLWGELVSVIGLPQLSGFMMAGITAGPHVFGIFDEHAVHELSPVNSLALALIALAGGADLRLDMLRAQARSLLVAHGFQTSLTPLVMTLVFVGLRPWMPFVSDMQFSAVVGVGILWGMLAFSRSPSATLAILSETRARGPLANHTLAFVMSSDVIVVIFVAIAISFVRPLVDPAATFSFDELTRLGREILGSVAIGTTLGLVLAGYLRLVGKQLVLLFFALGFGVSEVLRFLMYDPLLAFLTGGFVVQNLTGQGEALVHGIERTTRVVFVLFFAIAGAHLDLALLASLWPVALALAGSRVFVTVAAAKIGSKVAGDSPLLRRWSWSGLVSQAGLSLGIAVLIAREFPSFGAGFHALAVATIAINEMVGPVLFKLALDRTGESGAADETHESPVETPNVG